MAFALTVLAVFGVLVCSEIGWRRQWLQNEFGRKFVHILVGSFVAVWPFFLTWTEIRILSLAFLAGVIVSHYLKVFRAIHSVQRPTYGELFFAIAVGALTFVTESKGVYAAALLQMSLADGLAAIAGTRFGKGNTYRVFGHAKSVIGTGTFFVVSLAILIGYGVCTGAGLPVVWALAGASMASMLENIAVLGLDNMVVPAFVAGLLLVVS